MQGGSATIEERDLLTQEAAAQGGPEGRPSSDSEEDSDSEEEDISLIIPWVDTQEEMLSEEQLSSRIEEVIQQIKATRGRLNLDHAIGWDRRYQLSLNDRILIMKAVKSNEKITELVGLSGWFNHYDGCIRSFSELKAHPSLRLLNFKGTLLSTLPNHRLREIIGVLQSLPQLEELSFKRTIAVEIGWERHWSSSSLKLLFRELGKCPGLRSLNLSRNEAALTEKHNWSLEALTSLHLKHLYLHNNWIDRGNIASILSPLTPANFPWIESLGIGDCIEYDQKSKFKEIREVLKRFPNLRALDLYSQHEDDAAINKTWWWKLFAPTATHFASLEKLTIRDQSIGNETNIALLFNKLKKTNPALKELHLRDLRYTASWNQTWRQLGNMLSHLSDFKHLHTLGLPSAFLSMGGEISNGLQPLVESPVKHLLFHRYTDFIHIQEHLVFHGCTKFLHIHKSDLNQFNQSALRRVLRSLKGTSVISVTIERQSEQISKEAWDELRVQFNQKIALSNFLKMQKAQTPCHFVRQRELGRRMVLPTFFGLLSRDPTLPHPSLSEDVLENVDIF